jgi:SH3-like domain-containing protein
LISVIVLFFSISTFVFMQYNLSVLNAHNEAIVVNNECMAKSSPDNSASDLFRVYEGYKVKIETENGDWYEIMLPDGKKAWLNKEFLMIL